MAAPRSLREFKEILDLVDWTGVFNGQGQLPQIHADFLLHASTMINIVPAAINVTATATVAQLVTRYITSTSAAAVALTLPSAASVLSAISQAGTAPAVFDFYVDNSAGDNTITVTLPASITNPNGVTLTVIAGTVACFRLVFVTTTAAFIYRVV